MGAVLAALGDIGYGWAYRVLDSQYFGLAQRRNRVFIVGYSGGLERPVGEEQLRDRIRLSRMAAQVLFEPASVFWDTSPSRKQGTRIASVLTSGTSGSGVNKPGRRCEDDFNIVTTGTLNSGGNDGGFRTEPGEHIVAMQRHGSNVGEMGSLRAGNGNESGGVPFIEHTHTQQSVCHALSSKGGRFDPNGEDFVIGPLASHSADHGHAMTTQQAVEAGQLVVGPLTSKPYADNKLQESKLVAHTLSGEGADASEDGTGRGTPIVFDERNVMSKHNRQACRPGDPVPTMHEKPMAVAFSIQERAVSESSTSCPDGKGWQEEVAFTLEARHHQQSVAKKGVRRLTPVECERLQGFPDDWSRWGSSGEEISDSARYRMIGNGVSMPVIEWIIKRLIEVDNQAATESANG